MRLGAFQKNTLPSFYMKLYFEYEVQIIKCIGMKSLVFQQHILTIEEPTANIINLLNLE